MTKIIIRILGLIIGLAVFLVLKITLNDIIKPEGLILADGWELIEETGTKTVTLPDFHRIKKAGTVRYRTSFSYIPETDSALMLLRVPGNSLRVFMNGRLIGQIGSPDDSSSKFKNYAFTVRLPEENKDHNILEIEQTVDFVQGFTVPPFIIPASDAVYRKGLINFIYDSLLQFFIGGVITIGIILVGVYFKTGKKLKAYLFIGLGSALSAVYCLDFLHFDTLFTSSILLNLSKIFFISGFIACNLFVLGLNILTYNSKFIRVLQYPFMIITAAAFIFSPNRHILDLFLQILNGLLLIDVVIIAVMGLNLLKKSSVMLIPAIVVASTLFDAVYITFTTTPRPFIIQYGIAFSTLFFCADLILNYSKLCSENTVLFTSAHKDALTSAYNRKVLDQLKPSSFDTAAVVDLDDFKTYNDTYGHLKGDELLKNFVKSANKNFRESDIIVRLGGDEFLILLKGPDSVEAEAIISRIREEFMELHSYGFSYGIAKMRESISRTSDIADAEMYRMKKSVKNKMEGL